MNEPKLNGRTRTPLRISLTVVAGLGCAILAGCGSDDSQSAASESDQISEETTTEATDSEEAADEATDLDSADSDHGDESDDHDEKNHDHGDESHDHSEEIAYGDLNLLDDYTIEDNGFGTFVSVVVDEEAGTRTIASNAIPDHETGDFPNEANPNTISEQDESWTFPLTPDYTGVPTAAQVPAIAFNGVKFQPGTAERAVCDNGITYNIQAVGLADLVDIPQGLDFNNAHVQPWGEYHYHGTPEGVVDNSSTDEDLAFLGFAADGHLIYHSLTDAYSSSYRLGTDEREGTNCVHEARSEAEDPVFFGAVKDGSLGQDWDFDESYGDLDECNGTTIDGEYVYIVTDAYPYVPRCVMGAIDSAAAGDGGDVQGGREGRPERPAEGDAQGGSESRPERPAGGDDREAPPAEGEDPDAG